jgi:metallo-beta-lactamase family protein
MAEMVLSKNGIKMRLLFTGDIGRVPDGSQTPGRVVRSGPPVNEDPNLLVMESTYGNRSHPGEDVRPQLAKLITDTVARGGSVVVPAFAVERTQKFLFLLKELMATGRVPEVPVFVDSPMAIKAVEICMKYTSEFNEESRELIRRFGSPLDWKGFIFAAEQEDSRKINEQRYPCIIVSSSGMVSGGRILHHLMHRLPDPRNQVVFIGFQAPGTRGAIIKSGAKSVRIFSQEVEIRAQIAGSPRFDRTPRKPSLSTANQKRLRFYGMQYLHGSSGMLKSRNGCRKYHWMKSKRKLPRTRRARRWLKRPSGERLRQASFTLSFRNSGCHAGPRPERLDHRPCSV